MSQQENGVTGTGQQFGPAPDSKYYDMNQWSMTHVPHPTTRDVVEHPRPSKRRRVSGQPAFLRGSTETRYLGPLLTIYHAIPLAREALLFPPMKVHAYGHDPNWWSGTGDENFKSASIVNTGLSADMDNILCEIQSLMAFLDLTKRAYGSVDALADLQSFKSSTVQDSFNRLLDVWQTATMGHSPEERLTQVFTSVAMKETHYPNREPIMRHFHCLDPPVHPLSDADRTLYDILDMAIWDDDASDTLNDVWLNHCADVLTLRLYDPSNSQRNGQDVGLGVRIPAILYTDRYVEENRGLSWQRRTWMKDMYGHINKLAAQQERLSSVVLPDHRTVSVQQVLAVAREATAIAMKNPALQPNGVNHEDLEMQPLLAGGSTGLTQAQAQQCANELEGIMGRIARKLQRLEDQKNEIREQSRRKNNWLISPPLKAGEPPFHKYYLSGLSTKPWITYVRVKREKDLIDFEDVEDDPSASGNRQADQNAMMDESIDEEAQWDWWRISFSRDDLPVTETTHEQVAGPLTQQEAYMWDMARKVRQPEGGPDLVAYSVQKMREYEVIKAAREESNEVVCVYASENALRFQGSDVSDALRMFVERDNLAFEAELRLERREELERISRQEAVEGSLSQRQEVDQREGQEFMDIPLDSTRDEDYNTSTLQVPSQLQGTAGRIQLTANTNTSFNREMTPMSISSPKRESEDDLLDDEMSPKRPRSEDSNFGPSSSFMSEGIGGVETPTVGARSDIEADRDGEEEQPPPYPFEEQEMVERPTGLSRKPLPTSKIGRHAEAMLERYGHGDRSLPPTTSVGTENDQDHPEVFHIEHPRNPLR